MDFFYSYTTPILSTLTLALNIFSVLLLIAVLFPKTKYGAFVRKNIGKFLLELGLLMALGSIVGSIIYSNVIGFDPCVLCWWERTLIYPQLVIFAVGLYVKEKSVYIYSSVFAILTIILSGYHTYIQLAGSSGALCSSSVVSCSKVYFISYGYITIPTMALSTGLFFLIIAVLYRQYFQSK